MPAEPQITEDNGDFSYSEQAEVFSSKKDQAIASIMETWQKDAAFKLTIRKFFAYAFPIFLLVQNIITYVFIWVIFYTYKDSPYVFDLQPFLSVLTLGTLGETVLIVKIMVRWIFTDIKYNNHPYSNK